MTFFFSFPFFPKKKKNESWPIIFFKKNKENTIHFKSNNSLIYVIKNLYPNGSCVFNISTCHRSYIYIYIYVCMYVRTYVFKELLNLFIEPFYVYVILPILHSNIIYLWQQSFIFHQFHVTHIYIMSENEFFVFFFFV